MLIRKIFRTGNSHVVALTKEMLQKLKLEEGSNVIIELDEEKKCIIVKPLIAPDEKSVQLLDGIDNDYVSLVNSFIKEYELALKELAK
ncbi:MULTISPECIES: hypothetical protein [unclassified Carboxydocella]|uniref:AbrB/MazE/SpoVT family DNA-binding domain-containing protein n=1 Tax=unclassified Carboxydocella TaxID=2685367 RepID=UPI0009AC7529|nr:MULTISPECIES: hypothetical protein [unclassified Carboxydocella]GAW29230.1 hypothetical protein ULO1_18000 [Carboxydocella sp. ULO1]GAW30262.1 hypothetical protein JDF658_00270 [Carboxydocella sp. JDF658]